jgi:FkbM family methyltransferase
MTNDIIIPRDSMAWSLFNVKQLGFEPKTVIDVGAALGTFALYEVFPKSNHFLIEPIQENEPYLAQLCKTFERAEYIIAAASNKSGLVRLEINPNLVHSSIYDSCEGIDSEELELRTVQAITLDEICREHRLEYPYLIKIDVDGKELDVLEGAIQVLEATEYLIIEAAIFGKIYEIVSFMKSHGFVIYDIVDLSYRPLDRTLWQVDIAFVKESGWFRTSNHYCANQEQEEELKIHLKRYRKELITHIENLTQFNFLQKTALSEPTTLHQKAHECLIQGDYTQAANLYEQAIQAEPENKSLHWHLGLTLLLQGQEAEAQTTWLLGMTEGNGEQVDLWTAELMQVLEVEAKRRQALGDYPGTWMIRQHLREICPREINNLLRLIELSILLGRYEGEELYSLGVIEILKSKESTDVDSNLLMQVLKGVLDSDLLHPAARELYEQTWERSAKANY